jgi:transposase
MLSFPPTVRIYLASEPVDMRRSYDGLCGCVEEMLHEDPLSGHLFVFFNRRANQVKILVWDRNGFCIYGKRLSSGHFFYRSEEREVDFARLLLVLEGIDLRGSRQRKRLVLKKVA